MAYPSNFLSELERRNRARDAMATELWEREERERERRFLADDQRQEESFFGFGETLMREDENIDDYVDMD